MFKETLGFTAVYIIFLLSVLNLRLEVPVSIWDLYWHLGNGNRYGFIMEPVGL